MKLIVKILMFSVITLIALSVHSKTVDRAAQLVHDSPLTKSPQANASKVKMLKKDQQILVKKRQRAWYQVLTEDKASGWLKMLDVRFIAQAKREGEFGVKKAWNSLTTGRTEATASTGIRGFDEEDLKKAVAAPDQVALLTQFSSSKEKARAFAQKARLSANDLVVKKEE